MAEAEGEQKVPKTGKQGLMTGKYKWWLVGGLGLVAVLVFVFVRKSNTNAAGGTTSTTTSGLDPATQAAMQSALQGQAAAGYNYNAATGPAGPAGPTGPAGAAGAAGPAGPAGKVSATASATATVPSAKSSPQTQYYTVKAGDNLSKIARQFNVSGGWQSLYSMNRQAVGSNPNMIHPGLRLKV
jgi:nucleoid-associated protein YgaU